MILKTTSHHPSYPNILRRNELWLPSILNKENHDLTSLIKPESFIILTEDDRIERLKSRQELNISFINFYYSRKPFSKLLSWQI